jgi:hypothetical protein
VSRRTGVVLDRLIRRSWLDAAAAATAQGLSDDAFRAELDRLLRDQLPGDPTHGALGKTKTVLSHIWSRVPPRAQPLRGEALGLLDGASTDQQLALHWGMCLATYPFFRDLAAMIGRLIALQGSISRGQLRRRAAEQFGERTTIQRAVPTLIASLRDWCVLVETERGVFGNRAKTVPNPSVQRWLLEAVFLARGDQSTRFDDLIKHPALFPFTLTLLPHDLRDHPRLDVFRLGIDEAVVAWRGDLESRAHLEVPPPRAR